MKLRAKSDHRIREVADNWEDIPEEPKGCWIINIFGVVEYTHFRNKAEAELLKEIGNYFETEGEARKAVEKLKAFKRLEAKGFRFTGWEDLQAKMGIDDLMLFNRYVIDTDNVIGFRMDDYHDCIKDLNILFGDEE